MVNCKLNFMMCVHLQVMVVACQYNSFIYTCMHDNYYALVLGKAPFIINFVDADSYFN